MQYQPVKYILVLVQTVALLMAFTGNAQIRGIITDTEKGSIIDGVQVFVNNTTIETQSNEGGLFTLENLSSGFHELVLYKKGYLLYRSSMRIQANRIYNLRLSLTSTGKVKTKKPNESEHFTLKSMLSEGDSILLLNEDEIKMNTQKGKRVLSSNSVVVVENRLTGYRLTYYMAGLSVTDIDQAPVRYELLPASSIEQTIIWEKKRKVFFTGSQRHWLMAIVAGKLKDEGYSLQDQKGNEVKEKTIISSSSLENYVYLTINNPLTIRYKSQNNKIETSQVVTDGSVNVDATGFVLNAKALIVEGEMVKGLSYHLPNDYQPIAGNVEDAYSQTLEKFYEKIYVQTDKPYYYPGEAMWFKGYINYKEPAWRDSLSKVVYVELINPKKEIALTKTLKIDSGLFNNDFILPDTLKAGTYYLRAYTNLNRNFGDSNLFVKPIPILTITDKVDYTQAIVEAEESSLLTITSDKKIYNTRDKITLTLQTKDMEGKPIAANLSISVTDATQVVPSAEPIIILNGYPFEKEKQLKATSLKYPVEYGVGFRGRFVNDKGKPEKTMLTILQTKPRNMVLAETDEQGIFSTTGLDFYDSATFSIKADKAKDFPYGKVELLPRETTPINFRESTFNVAIQNTQSAQRIISEYEAPKDARMLKGVEIKAKRIEEPVDRVQRPYGKADAVLTEKQVNDKGYGNLAYSLVGKVPGLIVMPESGSIGFSRAGGQSISSGGGPLVTINDVPMGGSAYDIISSINPSTVKSIEITKRINVLFGSQGANGVIAIYTKQGASEEDLNVTPNFLRLEIAGYSSLRKFNEPDYESKIDKFQADYRSTLYWNPNVASDTQGKATISFYAADLSSRYRIVIEGINKFGEPVRSVHFVDVEE
jgi:hypothetical protein